MSRKETNNIILIEVDGDERRAAVLSENSVQEIIIERIEESSRIGNVYYGRVAVVNEAIHAAFVDIGQGRNCFLPLSDYPKSIKKGDSVFVQIAKEEISGKPARLSGYISIPGRFLIYMPNSSKGGVSRNILDVAERDRLRGELEGLKKNKPGAWIVRTQSAGRKSSEIASDAGRLIEIWDKIQKFSSQGAPGIVYRMEEFTQKILRELLNNKTDKIIIEPESEFEKAKKFLKAVAPDKLSCLRPNKDERSPFQIYGVENVIRGLTMPSVGLPSGGEIVIQSTEALTAIDVNSRGFKKKGSVEETSFVTNKEAAREIMRQIRLRNIGGIIVADLIDMERALHKKEIYDIMFTEASYDRAKIRIFPLNRLGLIEITRQRLEDNILKKITSRCDHCDGSGRQLSPRTMFIRIKRHLGRSNRGDFKGATLNIFVHPAVAEMFGEKDIDELIESTGKRIRIRADYKISEQEYEIEQ